jgi:hypothetical protein
MKKIVYSCIVLAGLLLAFTACESEDPDPIVEDNWETVTLDATAYESWVYFSFSENAEVAISDYRNSMDWDIGFHRYDVRLNCGTSGPGQGGSQSMGVVDFESVTEAPESGYSLNDSIGVILESGVWEYTNVPGDTVLSTWMNIDFSNPPPKYTLSNEIYVIRTADGRYARIWLKDYFDDKSSSGHVTMQYTYQEDGSRSFE